MQNEKSSGIQAVFFDFDGVVLDSLTVKTQAFAQMFRGYGAEVEAAVVAYHLANCGISRFEKFRYFYESLLKQPVTEKKLVELGKQFSELVLAKVVSAEFIPMARETLQFLKTSGVPAYVVSGTPDGEMRYIVEEKMLGGYFLEVHGSPRTKSEIIRDILGRKGYCPGSCWFFGDAMSDWQAAYDCGVNFIGIVPTGEISPFPAGTTVSNRVELPGV